MMERLFILLSCVLGVSLAQSEPVTITPLGAVTVIDGNNLTITCTDGAEEGAALELRENGVLVSGSIIPSIVSGLVKTFNLPVNRTRNGNTYDCVSGLTGMFSGDIALTAAWIDPISLNQSTKIVDDGQVTITITLNANPLPTITMDRVDGIPILNRDSRVTIGDASILFQRLNDTDIGNYAVRASNSAGIRTAIFQLSSGNSVCPTLLIIMFGIVLAATNVLPML